MCASVLSVTTGPFIKVLALHLPWSLDCMLAAPGKTYITVCLPLFSCFSFLHTKVPDPYTLLFFSSSPSLHPLCVSSHFLISVPSHPVVLKVWSGNATGILEGGFQQKGGKKTCFRYNSIHKLPRARMYRYFGFHALALIKHLKAKLSSDGGPRSYLCQFKGL